MRQVIRYEVEVFFLKSNLDLAVLGGAGEKQAAALSGCGKPQGVGAKGMSYRHRKREPPTPGAPSPHTYPPLHSILYH